MITNELKKTLTLPEELYPILDIKDGLVLISGTTNTGKTTMLQTLARGFDKKHSPKRGWILVHNDNPQDKIMEDDEELPKFDYFPNTHMTAEECKDIPNIYGKMFHYSPDLIVTDEMREPEDAGLRYHSSMTGHLVYSSIHASDVQTAILRYETLLRESQPDRTWNEEDIKKSLKAVIRMKRDENTGLPVVDEVKIF